MKPAAKWLVYQGELSISGIPPLSPRDAMPVVGQVMRRISAALDAARKESETLTVGLVVCNQSWAGGRIVVSADPRRGVSVRVVWFPNKPRALSVLLEPWSPTMSRLEWAMLPALLLPLVGGVLIAPAVAEPGGGRIAIMVLGFVIGVVATFSVVPLLVRLGVGIDVPWGRKRATKLLRVVQGFVEAENAKQPAAPGSDAPKRRRRQA